MCVCAAGVCITGRYQCSCDVNGVLGGAGEGGGRYSD